MGSAAGIGQGHMNADVFGATYQEPFTKRVGKILDPLAVKRSSGALTYDEAFAAQQQLEEAIAGFTEDQHRFALLGSKQAEVIAGSRKTMDPIIASWRSTLVQDLSTLPKPPEAPADPAVPEEAPTAQTILGGLTPQKKRQALPERSTILTGSYGSGLRPKKTILGY